MYRPPIPALIRFSRRVKAGWTDDRASGLAAEVAFFAVLSIFPGLLAVAAAVGWLDGLFGESVLRRVEGRLLDTLQTFLTENADGTIRAVQALFRQGSGGIFTVGMVTALWSASRGMAAALRAIAAIYGAEDQRSLIRRRLLALGLAVGSMLVVSLTLAMLVLGPLFGAGRAAAAALGVDDMYGRVWEWLGIPVASAVLVGWAVVILHAAPHSHRSWRPHLLAGASVGAGWLVGSLALRSYLAVLGGNAVFGILGGALVVLLWFYLLSLALMLGAEVNAVLDSPEDDAPVPSTPRSLERRARL